MFTLAHLSDPHLGPLPDPRLLELASKRVIGYVNWRRNRAVHLTNGALEALVADLKETAPDHIAVTGDLVNLGLQREIGPAAEWLAALGSAADVSAVPGNHDAYVPGSLDRATRRWAAHMAGDDVDLHHHPAPVFPFVRRRGKVAIVGASSAKATGPFMATGHFDASQALHLTELLQALEHEGLFRVVLIHHPPIREATNWHKRLVGGSRFRAAVAQAGAELVLHGHTHENTILSIAGPGGEPVPVVGVPSASQQPGGRRPPARYNLFSISGEPGSWECLMTERGILGNNLDIREIATRRLEPSMLPPPTRGEEDQGAQIGWSGAASAGISPLRRGSGTISIARRKARKPKLR